MTFRETVGSAASVRSVVLIDQAGLAYLTSGKPGSDLGRVMAGYAGVATREARQLADERLKKQTGRYKRSIRSTYLWQQQLLRVEADTDYAATLELGSRPHWIVVRQAENLVFYWEKRGVLFVGPAVYHPGQPRGKFILTDAVQRAAKKIGL